VDFSVIISLHRSDRADWFWEAALSVLDQTVVPKTLLVTIDGDLPGSHESTLLALKARYPNIEVLEIRHSAVNSRGVLLGKAVCEASSELLAIMDADDIAEPNRFSKQLKYFRDQPELDVVGSWVEEISSEDATHSNLKKVPCEHIDIRRYAKYRNPVNNMTVMFKRKAVISAGNYQGKVNFADYWLWVRMLSNGAIFANIPEVLVRARAAKSMIDRRRGVGYMRSEIDFFRSCYKLGFLTKTQAFTAGGVRAPLRLLPNWALSFIFNRFLR